MTQQGYSKKLLSISDEYVCEVYRVTKSFPKDEKFGLTSQYRRAAVSVALNLVEGYARTKPKVQRNLFDIAYGSLKESTYLTKLSSKLGYNQDTEVLKSLENELGAMLWGILKND